MAQHLSGAVLLLGAPGSGKTLLGGILARTHCNVLQVNIGQSLRATGKVQQHFLNPTGSSKQSLAQGARQLLSTACKQFKEQDPASLQRPTLPRVLLLECVKELEDAYTLMEVLEEHNIPLQQVLYITDRQLRGYDGVAETLCRCLNDSSSSSSDSRSSDQALRQAKWQQNCAVLLEFFSSPGVLAEIALWDIPAQLLQPQPAAAAADSKKASGTAAVASTGAVGSSTSSSNGTGSTSSSGPSDIGSSASASQPLPPPGTLAALGYAATGSAHSSWLSKVGWCNSATGSVRAVEPGISSRLSYGGSSQKRLVATQIEPVVSCTLVTSTAERQRVLSLAAKYTGLLVISVSGPISSAAANAGSSSSNTNTTSSTAGGSTSTSTDSSRGSGVSSKAFAQLMPVPQQSVTSAAHARWVAVPGRYQVSLKCDGTRHLLVSTGDPAHVYLLNRVGSLYRYPYSAWVTSNSACVGSSGSSGSSTSASTIVAGGDDSSSSSVLHNSAELDAVAAGAAVAQAGRLPAGTVLDGELVWLPCQDSTPSDCSDDSVTGPAGAQPGSSSTPKATAGAASSREDKQGFFLVFDALSIGGQQLWQLPLPDRLAQLQQLLGLPAADAVLRQAPRQPPHNNSSSSGSAGSGHVSPGISSGSTGSGSCGAGSGSGSDGSTPAHTASAPLPYAMHIDATEKNTGGFRRSNSVVATINSSIHKKQQAPLGAASLQLVYKPHYDVTAANLQHLQAAVLSGAALFPTDGLIFTPAAMPYAVGMQQLLLKWQSAQQTGADLPGKTLQDVSVPHSFDALQSFVLSSEAARESAKQLQECLKRLPAGLVYECLPLTAQFITKTDAAARLLGPGNSSGSREVFTAPVKPVWMPQSVRWDKAAGNDPEVLSQLEQRLKHPSLYCLSFEELLQTVSSLQGLLSAQHKGSAQAPSSSSNSSSSSSSNLGGNSGGSASSSFDGSASGSASSSACAPSSAAGVAPGEALQQPSNAAAPHPARAIPFDELHAAVQGAVTAGLVECSRDTASGLEVYCYKMSVGPPSSPLTAMCRGLVLHPGSKSVLATPFVRFGHLEANPAWLQTSGSQDSSSSSSAGGTSKPQDPTGSGSSSSRGRGRGAGRQQQRLPVLSRAELELAIAKKVSVLDDRNLQLYKAWGSQPPAAASFKLDGSLIIAFVWQGQLYTSTRRRMDSEQAIWARNWLLQHGVKDSLQPGWTYLFEAVYADNTHVIQYPFQGLVLLQAVNPSGCELPSPVALQQLARQLHVMAAPSISGTVPELATRLSQGCNIPGLASSSVNNGSPSRDSYSLTRSLGFAPAASKAAAFEGWVLQESGSRHKLVQASFTQTGSTASTALHPLVVWDELHQGVARKQLLQGLPAHYQAELDAQLAAFEAGFRTVQQQLHVDLQQAWFDGAAALRGDAATAACSDCLTLGHITGTAAPAGPAPDAHGNNSGSNSSSAAAVPVRAAAPDTMQPNTESSSTAAAVDKLRDGAAASPSVAACSDEDTSTTTSSSSSTGLQHGSSQWGVSSTAYAEALAYAVKKGAAVARSMFVGGPMHSSGSISVAPGLRGLILDCIKPSLTGLLPGYTPSAAFQQTYRKGWALGPRRGRLSALDPQPLIMSALTDQALMSVLGRLEGRDIGRALLVCRGWSRLLQGDAAFKAKAAAAGLVFRRDPRGYRRSFAGLQLDSDADSDDCFGYYSGYDGGYGSA